MDSNNLIIRKLGVSSIDKEVNYSVVFMGEIITGFDKKKVIANLAHITRLPIEEINNKFFSEQNCRVIIKKTNSLEKARKYHGKFSRAGMAVGIQMDFDDI
ncbi:MAG: hypothetical protein KZQ64_02840 [gamma proteobacterium symbiont of Bathyaustriella thionipta]|nr:hypothetical protein [gamma proteobacterium symbiont of Bathyaustriella thionipta]MCU7967149.1 hypothetical protein [gamma proteobacterium symbiont of Bathyaustriella thionipta]